MDSLNSGGSNKYIIQKAVSPEWSVEPSDNDEIKMMKKKNPTAWKTEYVDRKKNFRLAVQKQDKQSRRFITAVQANAKSLTTLGLTAKSADAIVFRVDSGPKNNPKTLLRDTVSSKYVCIVKSNLCLEEGSKYAIALKLVLDDGV